MHVFLGIRVVGRNLPAERLDQRNRRIAGRGDRLGQCAQVVVLGMTGRLDGVDRSGGDHPGPRFGRASAASKSSMPCTRPRSENTSRIGVLVK